eukprot:1445838-Pyramimonas_sp.AAC.2
MGGRWLRCILNQICKRRTSSEPCPRTSSGPRREPFARYSRSKRALAELTLKAAKPPASFRCRRRR